MVSSQNGLSYASAANERTASASWAGLAFADSFKSIASGVWKATCFEACCGRQAFDKPRRESGLTPRTLMPRVYIVTSLAGGTGSGMFIDLAYLARQKLQQLGHDGAEIVGLCFLPPTDNGPRRMAALANTFAALTELNHFSAKHTVFTAQYELGEVRDSTPQFSWKGPPLDRCLFFTLPEAPEAPLTDEAFGGLTLTAGLVQSTAKAARVIFDDCTSALGQVADECRDLGESSTHHNGKQNRGRGAQGWRPPLYQTVGLHRLVWPRRQLLDQAGRIVCRRVVERWMSKNAKPLVQAVKEWVNEQWEQNGFTADQLIARYQEACETALGQAPENAFQAVHQPVALALAPRSGKASEGIPNFAVVMDAMEKLDQLVGVPEDCRPHAAAGEPAIYQPGALETILQTTGEKVADHLEQKVAELAVCLIEDPNYRLAGAEESLRQMHRQVEQALETQESLAQELQKRATALYQRIHILTETSASSTHSSTWKPPYSRRGAAGTAAVVAELVELLKAYPKCRYQCLVLQRITALYVSVRGSLSDQLREVDFCRARLQDLAAVFNDATNVRIGPMQAPGAGRYLSAIGCKSVDEAVTQLESGVGAEELVELDKRMQALIRTQFKALLHVCVTSANVLTSLAPGHAKEAHAFCAWALSDADARCRDLSCSNSRLGRMAAMTRQETEDDLAKPFGAASLVVASPPARETESARHAARAVRKIVCARPRQKRSRAGR